MTLPTEFDASFSKALPMIERGNHLPARDIPAARNVLRAAAWTYVASALVTHMLCGRASKSTGASSVVA